MAFLTELHVRPHDDRRFELLQPLVYVGNTHEFTVPEGYMTDFASVPRMLWGIIPPHGKYTRAAIVHDFLYSHAPCIQRPGGDRTPITRKEADGIFLRIMRELGVRWTRRRVMYYAVRVGGWLPWRNYRRSGPSDSTGMDISDA